MQSGIHGSLLARIQIGRGTHCRRRPRPARHRAAPSGVGSSPSAAGPRAPCRHARGRKGRRSPTMSPPPPSRLWAAAAARRAFVAASLMIPFASLPSDSPTDDTCLRESRTRPRHAISVTSVAADVKPMSLFQSGALQARRAFSERGVAEPRPPPPLPAGWGRCRCPRRGREGRGASRLGLRGRGPLFSWDRRQRWPRGDRWPPQACEADGNRLERYVPLTR
jgi:hypothetical protein